MKYNRYIYSLFAGLFLSATLTSCSEDEGMEPGNDSGPSIIVYQYAASSPNNPDNDIVLRFATNNKTSEAYYLVEKTADKEAHVSSMGEEGYKDYVVSNGVRIEGASGEANVDVIVTDLYGAYTITAVAVGGNVKSSSETTFTGLEWGDMAVGRIISEFFGAQGEVGIRKAEDAGGVLYKAIGLYEDGYDVVFKVVNGTVTVDRQAIASDISGYGTGYVQGSGTLENGVITVVLKFTVSAGSFGDFTEQIVLP